ncbi:metal-dependent hydrolase [Dethiosulfatarculus sandiegensis]|uniref:metal-dependent hydrolase n=1 Tax=Dethiosulfatarculus sandiegensis TaxID=1429043 RepID=UPI0018D0268C|nr:metal-dependent hydrolase [Dethiosulfatarculus sandiegensis]
MTPLGHASTTYLAARALPFLSVHALLLGGVLPDIDFIFFPFPFFNQIHRVATHNVFFITLVAGIGALWVKENKAKIFFSLLIGGALHLFIDSIKDDNPTNGLGVAIFWPVSDMMFCPFNLATPDPTNQGWSNPRLDMAKFVEIICYEGVFWLTALVVLVNTHIKRNKRKYFPGRGERIRS